MIIRMIVYLFCGLSALAYLVGFPTHAQAAPVLRIYNQVGALSVKVGTASRLHIQGNGRTRLATEDDLKIKKEDGTITITCEPQDNEPIDLDVQIPFHFSLELVTSHGAITVDGMIYRALLKTDQGNINISAPWHSTRFLLTSRKKPKQFMKPSGYKFSHQTIRGVDNELLWRIKDGLTARRITFGSIQIQASNPGHIKLTNYNIPTDSPVKLPSQAPGILTSLLQADQPPRDFTFKEVNTTPSWTTKKDDLIFRSEVRVVNLIAAITDEDGRPVPNLQKHDFEVIEDGLLQKLDTAGSGDAPFNLAILLDLSGSTQPDRLAMKNTAQRFVDLARPHDNVAIYTLAGNAFHVISRLTSEKNILRESIAHLPNVSGASPLYDSIVLAYAEDFPYRPGERNALIVISDGIDNRVSKQEMPSRISFKKLLRGVTRMNALIYPVFLRSGERFGRGWSRRARKQMGKLAKISGGRLFPALSIQDLDPVFDLIEQELRSVYNLSYYPKNQTFNNAWRKVDVKIKKQGVSIRTRNGYFAH